MLIPHSILCKRQQKTPRFPGRPTEAYLVGALVPWGPEKTSQAFVSGLKPGGPRERRLYVVKS